MIIGLSGALSTNMFNGLVHQGISPQVATRVANLPPVSTLFAALLGYNPVAHLLGPSVLAHLSAGHRAVLEGRSFFPRLISVPFHRGLRTAFDFAIAASLLAAVASWIRGGRYVYVEKSAEHEELVQSDEQIAEEAGVR
jgi:hypothetical protein